MMTMIVNIDDDDYDDNLSDESEEGGRKVDGTILIYWLVHPDKHQLSFNNHQSPITIKIYNVCQWI